MEKHKILIVIPTYNCLNQILILLQEINDKPANSNVFFWVIDNISLDGTFESACKFISENAMENVRCFQTVQNNSLGGTHKIAFNEAIAGEYNNVGIFHGDNQGNYGDLLDLIDMSQNEGFQYSYLGARFAKGSQLIGYSRKRIMGNLILNAIYSILKWRKLQDLGSGINLYRVKDLQKLDYLCFGNSLTFNYELLLAMLDFNLPYKYVPIEWKEEDQVSNAKNISIFLSGLRILIRNKMGRKSVMLPGDQIYKLIGQHHE
jgi:hypothetical protein